MNNHLTLNMTDFFTPHRIMSVRKWIAAFALVAALPACATADDKIITITTHTNLVADSAKGVEFSAASKALNLLIKERKFEEADRKAKENCRSYESIFDSSKKQFSFQTTQEFEEFSKSSKLNFEWIEWGYKNCLQVQAFVAVERRDLQQALSMLRKLEYLAPVSAGTSVEIGYVLNQLAKPTEALQTYRHAHELSKQYSSQRPYLAMSLRGIGFSLIELKQLDEAEKAFQESLQIEPENKLAQNELAYIQQLRSAK